MSGNVSKMSRVRWTQGLRKHGDDCESDWREVVYARLSQDFHKIRGGLKTREAEEGLGIPESRYYYIHRCEPDFSDSAISFAGGIGEQGVLAPFDTGGLWHGHLPGTKGLAGERKKTLLGTNSFNELDGLERFVSWGIKSFQDSSWYTGGEPPRCGPYAQELQQDKWGKCERVWTWEARVPLGFRSEDFHPVCLVMQTSKFREYGDWVQELKRLSDDEREAHIDFVDEIFQDCGDMWPGDFLNKAIKGILVW